MFIKTSMNIQSCYWIGQTNAAIKSIFSESEKPIKIPMMVITPIIQSHNMYMYLTLSDIYVHNQNDVKNLKNGNVNIKKKTTQVAKQLEISQSNV